MMRQATRVRAEPLGPGPSPDELVRRLAGRPGLVCLWGAWAGGGAIVACDPVRRSDDPAVLADLAPRTHVDEAAERPAERPVEGQSRVVGGGWFGVLGYDVAPHLAFYDHLLRYADGEWWFESLGARPCADDALLEALREPARDRPQWTVGEFDGPPPAGHLDAVERAIELIRAGELYQVNVCTRLRAPFAGSAAGLFADAAARLAPAHGAFVDLGDGRAVVSLSPELFLRRRGDLVTTSPIKGTAPRSVPADTLRRSAKDAAENVMIVDLMRNDLGRVARTGTVRVPELLSVEPHPGVWHLVSTVTARVDVDDAELLAATFPPGSVTGAPKVRAMQAIGDLEPVRRGVYTGAIGFASPGWGAEFNVAIRTFEVAGDSIELGVGGGITADSVPMLEWRECLHKAAPLLGAIGARVTPRLATPDMAPTGEQLRGGLIETILTLDGEPVRLADHLARLDRSARELYGRGRPDDLAARVRSVAVAGRGVARVIVRPDGSAEVSAAPAGPPPACSDVRVVARRPGLWRHKWADRRELDVAERTGMPLFVADDGAVLETSRGNVFLLLDDGTLVTPPLRDDLLPGITRRALLDAARDAGRPTRLATFDVEELSSAVAFWTSSLSLVVPIASVDGVDLPRRDGDLAELAAGLRGRAQVGGAKREC
jgi:anthranilate/para-aminobenzoate synthase component I/branched-subunit amino acid aminotransferase/4-amino-4-deoxychorismate lyase